MSYNSKYTGRQVEELLDQVANGEVGGGGGITSETDPIFSASAAAKITDSNISSWNDKVDKVDGKQLSTEDFTTLLKQKLDGLSNYDDTAIQASVTQLRTDLDTLVSGDTTTAIKTFNEVIAFLEGISDTEDLASIIASIEQQIAAKYTKPSTGIPKTDLASDVQTSLGKADTALQSYTEQYKGTVTGVKMNGTTKNPSSGVVDLGTVITAHQDISGKQDKLVSGTNIKTINGQSLLGSGNIVIEGGSGGTSSGGSGAYAEVNHGTSDTTFTLTPNTFHVWDEVAILDLSFGAETSGVANEYLFQFTSGATATTLTLPDDIKWANDAAPTIAENMIYQISVLKGLASVLEFSNAVELIENKATISNGMAKCTVSFAYPVASEITVNVRSGDGPATGVFSTGDQTKTISLMGPSEAHIESITPSADSMYIYTF